MFELTSALNPGRILERLAKRITSRCCRAIFFLFCLYLSVWTNAISTLNRNTRAIFGRGCAGCSSSIGKTEKHPGIINDREQYGKYPGVYRIDRKNMYFRHENTSLFHSDTRKFYKKTTTVWQLVFYIMTDAELLQKQSKVLAMNNRWFPAFGKFFLQFL